MPADPDVPKLPRGRGVRMSGPVLIRIGMTATLLVMVILLAQPCSDAVSRFVTSYGQQDAGAPPPRPDALTGKRIDISDLDRAQKELEAMGFKSAVDAGTTATSPRDPGTASDASSAP